MKHTKIFVAIIIVIINTTMAYAINDPTRPPNTTALANNSNNNQSQQAIIVTGVIKTTNGYRAIINHQSYQKGDEISNLTIVKITPNAVVFTDGQTEFNMRVQPRTTSGITISKSSGH